MNPVPVRQVIFDFFAILTVSYRHSERSGVEESIETNPGFAELNRRDTHDELRVCQSTIAW